MELIKQFISASSEFIPFLVVVAIAMFGLVFTQRFLAKRWQDHRHKTFNFQIIMLGLTFLFGVILIVALPVSDTLRGQLLSLIGILLSAAIALSSTTFIGNILAGIMLRIIKSAKPGDFITVADVNGRITEMNLLHVEVQTEDRDLVTFPNMLVVTQPMKVVRASGTIVSAEVSLGYDVPRQQVSELLREAAKTVGLTDTFVQIRELGDYSIVYRVAGLLEQVSGIISTRSKLREAMLDSLHSANIEIVSPTFMNTRAYNERASFVPELQHITATESDDAVEPESIFFDKADIAASAEKVRQELRRVDEEITSLNEEPGSNFESKLKILEMEKNHLTDELAKVKEAEKACDDS